DRRVLRRDQRRVPAEVRPPQLDPNSRVLFRRRAPGEALQGGDHGGGDLPRRAERDEPLEPGGDRVRPDLRAAFVHHGVADVAGHLRDVVMVTFGGRQAPPPRSPRLRGGGVVIVLAFAIAAVACKPDLNQRTDLVTAPRILAVRADPPEAVPGTPVTLT